MSGIQCPECLERVEPDASGTCPRCAASIEGLGAADGFADPSGALETSEGPELGVRCADLQPAESPRELAQQCLPDRELLAAVHVSWKTGTLGRDFLRAHIAASLGPLGLLLVDVSYEERGQGLVAVDQHEIHFLDLTGRRVRHTSGPRSTARAAIERLSDEHAELTLSGAVHGTWFLREIVFPGNLEHGAEVAALLEHSQYEARTDERTRFLARSVHAHRERDFEGVFSPPTPPTPPASARTAWTSCWTS